MKKLIQALWERILWYWYIASNDDLNPPQGLLRELHGAYHECGDLEDYYCSLGLYGSFHLSHYYPGDCTGRTIIFHGVLTRLVLTYIYEYAVEVEINNNQPRLMLWERIPS